MNSDRGFRNRSQATQAFGVAAAKRNDGKGRGSALGLGQFRLRCGWHGLASRRRNGGHGGLRRGQVRFLAVCRRAGSYGTVSLGFRTFEYRLEICGFGMARYIACV